MANWYHITYTAQVEVPDYVEAVAADLRGHVEGFVANENVKGSVAVGETEGAVASDVRGHVATGEVEGFVPGPTRGDSVGKDHG